MDNKTEIINLMENDIFGLDRELDFGIYHLFKVSKKQIEKILKNITEDADDDIYDYLYNFFSLYYEGGDFGYTKRAFATFTIPYIHKEYQLNSKEKCSFESSHSFFYDGEETKFTWKTKESYYIKSTKYFNKLVAKIDNYDIVFQVVGEDKGFDSKRTRLFKLLSAKKDENKIILNFNISKYQTPKHSIYLIIKNMIDNDVNEVEYIASEDFEKTPPRNSIFTDFEIDKYKKYLFKDSKSIFENKKTSEEDNTQIFSYPKLYITKKEYVEKIYTKNDLKKMLDKKAIDIDNDIGKIFKKDKNLEFFYRLDRAFNDFITGVDSDYFIHKNLKRFLLTELDKFIKNYVLYDTEKLLSKEGEELRKKALKFKQKAEELIDFLAAVEEFQKYIWEKRKLIKKVHYIISSNKLKNDEDLLKEILKNKNQTDEWKNLGLCDKSPNIDDLKQKPYPVDTKHFDEEFKIRLLSGFSDLDSETDGILIKSENFQALKFLEPKFKEQIKCIYIDPPYNTGNDGFVYKDKYKESSWLSMMNDRLRLAKDLMKEDGVIFSSIDDRELANLSKIKNNIFENDNFLITFCWIKGKEKEANNLGYYHEYIISFAKNKEYIKVNLKEKDTSRHITSLPEKNLVKGIKKIYKDGEPFQLINLSKQKDYDLEIPLINGEVLKRKGYLTPKTLKKYIEEGRIFVGKRKTVYVKSFLSDEREGSVYGSIIESNIGTTKKGGIEIREMFGEKLFSYPKPTGLLKYLIKMITNSNDYILDFFAGSGTTADAVIRLNKENGEKRKFILIEVNDYFETVIIPRIKKVSFSTEWKNGKAQKSNGIGGIYQYIYLQQYDELIENLKIELKESDIEAEYLFNPLKNNINEIEIKPTLEILFSFIYHKGFKLKEVKKEENFLIGICEEGVVVLGEGKTDFKQLLDKYTSKVYTNLKPENNINPDKNKIEIITSADFKGI